MELRQVDRLMSSSGPCKKGPRRACGTVTAYASAAEVSSVMFGLTVRLPAEPAEAVDAVVPVVEVAAEKEAEEAPTSPAQNPLVLQTRP